MHYLTISKPREEAYLFLFPASGIFFIISSAAAGCSGVLGTIAPPLSTWQKGSNSMIFCTVAHYRRCV